MREERLREERLREDLKREAGKREDRRRDEEGDFGARSNYTVPGGPSPRSAIGSGNPSFFPTGTLTPTSSWGFSTTEAQFGERGRDASYGQGPMYGKERPPSSRTLGDFESDSSRERYSKPEYPELKKEADLRREADEMRVGGKGGEMRREGSGAAVPLGSDFFGGVTSPSSHEDGKVKERPSPVFSPSLTSPTYPSPSLISPSPSFTPPSPSSYFPSPSSLPSQPKEWGGSLPSDVSRGKGDEEVEILPPDTHQFDSTFSPFAIPGFGGGKGSVGVGVGVDGGGRKEESRDRADYEPTLKEDGFGHLGSRSGSATRKRRNLADALEQINAAAAAPTSAEQNRNVIPPSSSSSSSTSSTSPFFSPSSSSSTSSSTSAARGGGLVHSGVSTSSRGNLDDFNRFLS